MIRVMELVRDIASGEAPYEFVDAERPEKAAKAMALGVDCLLRTQIRQEGKLTAWCAQHDATSLEPAWARAYEPPSLSGSESVGIVRFLMNIEKPSKEIVAAVEGAVEWLRKLQMKGWRSDEVKNADGRRERLLIADPTLRLFGRVSTNSKPIDRCISIAIPNSATTTTHLETLCV